MSGEAAEGPVLQLDPGGPARLALPLRVTVQGIEAVLVSAHAYDALFQASRKSIGSLSRIERDPEVKAYVDARLATHEMPTLREEIIRQFGRERAPSSSALGRYSVARRRAAAAVTRPAKVRRGPRGSG